MLCGQVGIAGSVTMGDYVTLGGRVSICDHIFIASKVRLAANSCVTKNITEAGDYGGFPAVSIHECRKQVVSIRQTSKEFWYNRQMKSCGEILMCCLFSSSHKQITLFTRVEYNYPFRCTHTYTHIILIDFFD